MTKTQSFILAIDQGTTSSRAVLFRDDTSIVATAQQEFPQYFPASGWVEHDPDDIWRSTLEVCRDVLRKADIKANQVASIGIANQRETVVVWDRVTGIPVHRAIVWQDRRTSDRCADLKLSGAEPMIRQKTGLRIDPYFSATKIAWLLDTLPGMRQRAERKELAAGTIDTFLIWKLTGGKIHATDATNASRTLLYNINSGDWDDDLLRLFDIPRSVLPDIRDSSGDYGTTLPALLGHATAIGGAVGDQQGALIGSGSLALGMLKATYGTGCFALLNTGTTPVFSQHQLLTTVAYQLNGERTYALEGAIFIAGAAVQWLRDGLRMIDTAAEAGDLAQAADPTQQVYLVPAFVGLGAPYWDPKARGAIFGLTRNTGPREFAKAALEAVCFQTYDLLTAMRADWPGAGAVETVMRVDGGMAVSDWTMQRLADILNSPVDRPTITETTALGAAYLAGRQAGLFGEPDAFAQLWQRDRRFTPSLASDERSQLIKGWADAVSRTLAG